MQTPKIVKVLEASWIWSKWLRLQHRSSLNYQNFTHYEFIEDDTKRGEIKDDLAKLIYSYHTSSPVNTNLLVKLKYRRLATVFSNSNDQRPHDNRTRTGNLIEILACEFAKKQGYDIPILRLRYNPNPEQSMKGDDILGFKFPSSEGEREELLVGEGKFRAKHGKDAIKEAYDDLIRKTSLYPASMEFVATILNLEGDQDKAAKIRQMRQKVALQSSSVVYNKLLFLGTVGQPTNPFEYLDECQDKLLPHLIAANVIFKQDFHSWITDVYAKEYWD